MKFTREQVNAAKMALGLHPDDTRSVSIYPDAVFVETVARVDGQPQISNGELVITRTDHVIEEASDDGDS